MSSTLDPRLVAVLTSNIPTGFRLLDEGDIMDTLFEAKRLRIRIPLDKLRRVSKPTAIERLLDLWLIKITPDGYVEPAITETEWERILR